MRSKPVIAMDLSSTGKGGGPFVSTSRIMNSGLKNKYEFKVIYYRTELGRGISIKRIKDLVNQIKNIQPDIVHFSGLQLAGFHIAIACILSGIKNTLVTVHGTSADALHFHWMKKIISVYVFEYLTLFLTKNYCGVSNYITNRVNSIFKRKCAGTIYNFPPVTMITKTNFKLELGLKESDIVVVSVARINKDKGYHIFDEVIKRFKNINNIKFLIIGNGDYLPEMKNKLMEQIVNRQVYFLGHRDDIQQILKGCDIFVLPTLHETLSIALLEASVEGLAIIASNTGGVPEIVENDYNGLLVEPGNINELTKAINQLVANKDKRDRLAKNAKKRVAEKFSSSSIEAKIDTVYQSLLK